MGYISYPRSAGERLDRLRVQEVIRLIKGLGNFVMPSTLYNILALVNQIGWHNLPSHIKAKLLALLREHLYPKLDPEVTSETQEQQSYRSNIQTLNSKIVNIGLSLNKETNLPIHERLNATGLFDFRVAVPSIDSEGIMSPVLIDSSGMVLTIVASGQEAIENQGLTITQAIHAYPKDADAIKDSYLGGKYSAYDALEEYRQSHSHSKGVDKYELGESFPHGLLIYRSVRSEIFKSVNRPCDTYGKLKKVKMPGSQKDHFIAHNLFLDPTAHVKNEKRHKQKTLDNTGKYHDNLSVTVRVHDDQTFGTEHRFITDQTILHARRFRSEGRQGTLSDWLVCMEESYVKLLNCSLIRDKEEEPYRECNLPEAKTIARAIAEESRQQFERLGVPMDLGLSNKIADLRMVEFEYPFKSIEETE